MSRFVSLTFLIQDKPQSCNRIDIDLTWRVKDNAFLVHTVSYLNIFSVDGTLDPWLKTLWSEVLRIYPLPLGKEIIPSNIR